MRHHPVPSSTCVVSFYIGTKFFSSATDEKIERKWLFVTAATASLRLLCPALTSALSPSPTLLLETVAKAYTAIGIHKHRTLSLSLLTVGGIVPSSRLGDISLRDGL